MTRNTAIALKFNAVVWIICAVCVVFQSASLLRHILTFESWNDLWNDPNARKLIIIFSFNILITIFAAALFTRLAWRKKSDDSVS